MAEPVRIALTISGAVSLGAFEGGALAALLTFVQSVGPGSAPGGAGRGSEPEREAATGPAPWPLTVDVMSGASAGSITALLAARTLTAGLDPVAVMREAWVTAPSLRTLTRGAARAPLTPDGLRARATEILAAPKAAPVQPAEVTVHMALTALAGLRYTIPDLAFGHPLQATTHLDWAEIAFGPDAPVEAFTTPRHASAVDFALASGASPLGFPPYPLNRRLRPDDWDTYVRNGVTGLPDDGWLWYTDGGTIENEPLGRTLDLAADADRGWPGGRVHLLVHPHPTGGGGPGVWSGADAPPAAWLRSLVRADRIQRTQTLFDDLRRAEKTNSRLLWRRQLHQRLLAHRDALDEAGQRSFDRVLEDLLDEIRTDRSRLRAQARADRVGGADGAASDGSEAGEGGGDSGGRTTPAPPAPDLSPSRALDAVLDQVTGTGGRPVAFGVISPTELADAHRVSVEALLAGEHLFHFGGFLDERLRAHDFAVGFDAALGWLRAAITANGPLAGAATEADLAQSLEATARRAQPWSLPAPRADGRARLRAAALGVRTAGLAARDLLAWGPWRRGGG